MPKEHKSQSTTPDLSGQRGTLRQSQTQTRSPSAQSSSIGGAQPQDAEFAEQHDTPLRTSRSYVSTASATDMEDLEPRAQVAHLRIALANAHADVEQALSAAVYARMKAARERKARADLEQLLQDVQSTITARLRGIKRAREEEDEGQDAGAEREKRART